LISKPLFALGRKAFGGALLGWGGINAAFGLADANNATKALSQAARSGREAASMAAAGSRPVGAYIH
jgi:hypothetical protein